MSTYSILSALQALEPEASTSELLDLIDCFYDFDFNKQAA